VYMSRSSLDERDGRDGDVHRAFYPNCAER
jgi:hypothetical protein